MRSTRFLFIAAAASVAILPACAFAQGPADELPCVGYGTFEKNGNTTEMLGLAVGDVPEGSKVTLNCTGNSCSFATRSFTMKNNVKTLALTDMFQDTNLKPGTTIEIRVTKPGWVGKVFQYEVLESGDAKQTTQCIAGDKTVLCKKK